MMAQISDKKGLAGSLQGLMLDGGLFNSADQLRRGGLNVLLLDWYPAIKKALKSGVKIPVLLDYLKGNSVIPQKVTRLQFYHWFQYCLLNEDRTIARRQAYADLDDLALPENLFIDGSVAKNLSAGFADTAEHSEQEKTPSEYSGVGKIPGVKLQASNPAAPVLARAPARVAERNRFEDYDFSRTDLDQLWGLYSDGKIRLEEIPDKYRMDMIAAHWDFKTKWQSRTSYDIWKYYYQNIRNDLKRHASHSHLIDGFEEDVEIPDLVANRVWQPQPEWIKKLDPMSPRYPFLSPVDWFLYDSNGLILDPVEYVPLPWNVTLYMRPWCEYTPFPYGSIYPEEYSSSIFAEDLKIRLSSYFNSHGGCFMPMVKILAEPDLSEDADPVF